MNCSVAGCANNIFSRGMCQKHYARWSRHGDPLAGRTFEGEPLAWLTERAGCSQDGCLIWPFARVPSGRGEVNVDGIQTVASRYMCVLANGKAPSPAHEAAHNCGNGHLGCVNPKHLRWATTQENWADRALHGTDSRGERHPMAALTAEQVLAIRADSRSAAAVAKSFGIRPGTVNDIRARRSWRHVK